MKFWVEDFIVWFLVLAAAVSVSVLLAFSAACRSPVSVNVKNEIWQCENSVQNDSGEVTFTGCKRDGSEPVDQKTEGGAGDEKIDLEGFLPRTFDVRLN